MKPENKTISQLKKDVWKVFSLWIRQRDSVDGFCKCITCEKILPIEQMQSGHGIGGRHNYLLFSEELNNAQCAVCNIWKGGEYGKYASILIKRHGFKWYDEMAKYKVKTFTKKELIKLLNYYKGKLK